MLTNQNIKNYLDIIQVDKTDDIESILEKLRDEINNLSEKIAAPTKYDLKKDFVSERQQAIEIILVLTCSAIIVNLIKFDKYDLLRADVSSKYFSSVRYINNFLTYLLERLSKDINYDSQLLSMTEIAKWIENPYFLIPLDNKELSKPDIKATPRLESESSIETIDASEIPKIDDKTIIVIIDRNGDSILYDKINVVAYVNGIDGNGNDINYKKTFYTPIENNKDNYYTIIKYRVVGLLNSTWKLLVNDCFNILQPYISIDSDYKTKIEFDSLEELKVLMELKKVNVPYEDLPTYIRKKIDQLNINS